MPQIPDHAKKVFDGIIHDVYHFEQELYDGSTTTFEMLKRASSAQCIPIVGDKILLIKDTQPNRETLYAACGGQVDPGETPEQAVEREMMEETGYSAESFELYQTYSVSSKVDWDIYTYIARNATQVQTPKEQAGEKIEPFLVTFDEFVDIVCSEGFRDIEISLTVLRMVKNGTIHEFKELLFPN